MVSERPNGSNAGFARNAEAGGPSGLAWWLAKRGLFSPRLIGRTVSAVLGIGLCLTAALVPLALAAGSRSARELALRRRPLCIWVGDRSVTDQVTGERRAELQRALLDRLGEAVSLVREVPFDEFSYQWVSMRRRGAEPLRYDFVGRTMGADDPLWGRMALRQGRAPRSGERGVVVGASMLRELIGDAAIPESLEVILPASNQREAIPLLGVLEEDEIPSGHAFAFDPEYEWQLRVQNPDERIRSVTTGPVGETWGEVERLPEEFREALRKVFRFYELRWPPVAEKRLEGGQSWWLRSEADEDPTRREWALTLEKLGQALERAGLKVDPRFVGFTAPSSRTDPQPRTSWNRLTLATEDPSLLRRMGQAAVSVGLPTYDVVIAQMEQIDREAAVWAWANLGIGVGSGVVAGLLLHLLARGRVRAQQHPIGMLKAMGGSDDLLMRVHLLEAVVMWGGGLLVGGLLTVAATMGIGVGMGWSGEVWANAHWPTGGVVLVVVGSLGISLAGSLAATRSLASGSPIELIKRE